MMKRRKPTIIFEEINGDRISPTGPRMPWRGSRRPHESSFLAGSEAVVEVMDLELESSLRRLPFFVGLPDLELEVPGRGREMPAFRALTRSLQ